MALVRCCLALDWSFMATVPCSSELSSDRRHAAIFLSMFKNVRRSWRSSWPSGDTRKPWRAQGELLGRSKRQHGTLPALDGVLANFLKRLGSAAQCDWAIIFSMLKNVRRSWRSSWPSGDTRKPLGATQRCTAHSRRYVALCGALWRSGRFFRKPRERRSV